MKRKLVTLGAAIAVLLCVLYIYAHFFAKDIFIQKLSEKGIEAQIKSVEIGLDITFYGITLNVKDSNATIESISSNYSLSELNINNAFIKGRAEDYLSLRPVRTHTQPSALHLIN